MTNQSDNDESQRVVKVTNIDFVKMTNQTYEQRRRDQRRLLAAIYKLGDYGFDATRCTHGTPVYNTMNCIVCYAVLLTVKNRIQDRVYFSCTRYLFIAPPWSQWVFENWELIHCFGVSG